MPDINLGPDVGKLPEYDIIEVRGGGQRRRVGLLGLLTDDKALYRPGAFGGAAIAELLPCAERMQRQLYDDEGVDLVLPMTHQVLRGPPSRAPTPLMTQYPPSPSPSHPLGVARGASQL